MPPVAGDHPLVGTKGLPHVTVSFPGEHWSNNKAIEDIVPGSAVITVPRPAGAGSVLTPGNELGVRVARATDPAVKVGIALRTVQDPDTNTGPTAAGPNEIMNRTILNGEYVHRYQSGAFWLTLVAPRADWGAGDLVGWDADGARPAHIPGAGSWNKDADADIDSLFEVMEVRRISGSNEVILGVRSLRGQF